MSDRSVKWALVLAATMSVMMTVGAQAADDAKYPNWKGQWDAINPRLGGQTIKFDPHQGLGAGAAGAADAGISEGPGGEHGRPGQGRARQLPDRPLPAGRHAAHDGGADGRNTSSRRKPPTSSLGSSDDAPHLHRRPRLAARRSSRPIEGYSIGRWIDEDGDGRYDVLEVETRGPFKGPRAYDATGLPLHFDNQSTFKERFHLDKNDPNLLHDEITVFDHALTRPWSVDKTFRRNPNPHPNWAGPSCVEGNHQVVIGKENYFLSADGLLMPAKKDQAPPDLRYFKQSQK